MDYEITKLTDEAVELLKHLIAIPSVSREETEAADCLERFMNDKGLRTCREANNIWTLPDVIDDN